jgi:hypothetical protein
VAVNITEVFTGTVAVVAERETEVGGVIVTVSVVDFPGSATAVAVIIEVTLLATLAGASYSTDMVVCWLRAPGPVSFQVTPCADGSFLMIAVMVTDWPCAMVCELPPLKLIESTGGGVLVPPPQPDKIPALRHPNTIKAIFLGPCMANLLQALFQLACSPSFARDVNMCLIGDGLNGWRQKSR